MFFCIKITEIYRRNKHKDLLFVIKKDYICNGSRQPGGEGKIYFCW